MPIQIYRKFHLQKLKRIQIKKNSYIFHISVQNIDCGYSLETPRRGGSNEYPQSMFCVPVNPSQNYIGMFSFSLQGIDQNQEQNGKQCRSNGMARYEPSYLELHCLQRSVLACRTVGVK